MGNEKVIRWSEVEMAKVAIEAAKIWSGDEPLYMAMNRAQSVLPKTRRRTFKKNQDLQSSKMVEAINRAMAAAGRSDPSIAPRRVVATAPATVEPAEETLHDILATAFAHMIAETIRKAITSDIVRDAVDEAMGISRKG